MTFVFKNYWGTKVFELIIIQSILLHNSESSRRITHIGLLNFCIIINGKRKYK
jgi:hypothetical protein